MIKSIFLRHLPLVLGVLALTSCATATLESKGSVPSLAPVSIADYSKVTAKLDFAHAIATTPIDEITVQAPAFNTKIFHAIDIRTDQCMVKRGFQEIAPKMDWTPYPEEEDRGYGAWGVENASKYGLDMAPDRGPRDFDTVPLGVEYNKAYAPCMESAKEGLMSILSFTDAPNIDARIIMQAHEMTRTSAAGKKAIASWRTCMEDRGLVLDPDDGFPSAQYKAQGKESEIKATVTEATCGVETGAVQTLYDIQARYEQAYIDSQAAQIQAFKKKRDQIEHELDEIIAGR